MTTHPLRWDALIGGLIFTAISLIWLVDHFQLIVIDLSFNLTYVLPTVLIIGGLFGIAATLRKPRQIQEGEDHE